MAETDTRIMLMKNIFPQVRCNFLPFLDKMAINPATRAVNPKMI
jgi:hypothetical protein